MMWYKRSEFDRYARYMSKGSAHEFFEYEDMEDVQIPIPSFETQKAIASIYNVYKERQRIAEALKEQLKKICPVLIRGSLSEWKFSQIAQITQKQICEISEIREKQKYEIREK